MVLDDGAVQFFDPSSRFAPLKIHDGVGAVRDGLVRLEPEVAWGLRAIVGRPILVGRRLFHQEKWLALSQPTHQGVRKGNFGKWRIAPRITVPGELRPSTWPIRGSRELEKRP